MSEATPRTIGGLAPRAAGSSDLSRLQRRNRLEATPVPDVKPEGELSATAGPSINSDTTAAATDRITVYVDHALRVRARTAYRATAHLEDDRTWSDFIERAILREVERREKLHNAGQTYPGTDGPLAPGRSVA